MKTLPKIIDALCGQTFVFKIRLTNMNLKEGYESYVIAKNDKLENEYKQTRRVRTGTYSLIC